MLAKKKTSLGEKVTPLGEKETPPGEKKTIFVNDFLALAGPMTPISRRGGRWRRGTIVARRGAGLGGG